MSLVQNYQCIMEITGENIPRATMVSYLKQKFPKIKISTEFIEGMLKISKQYITNISNKANQICTTEKKKTISLDHFYQSVKTLNLSNQMEELKQVEKQVKQQADHKNQIKKEIQKNYDEMIKENGNMIKEKYCAPVLKQINPHYMLINLESQAEDYENQEVQQADVIEIKTLEKA